MLKYTQNVGLEEGNSEYAPATLSHEFDIQLACVNSFRNFIHVFRQKINFRVRFPLVTSASKTAFALALKIARSELIALSMSRRLRNLKR